RTDKTIHINDAPPYSGSYKLYHAVVWNLAIDTKYTKDAVRRQRFLLVRTSDRLVSLNSSTPYTCPQASLAASFPRFASLTSMYHDRLREVPWPARNDLYPTDHDSGSSAACIDAK